MKKILAGVAVYVVGVICGLIFICGSTHTQAYASEGDVMSKLNEISRSQAQMVDMLNSMKEEIGIIKIRITQMQ